MNLVPLPTSITQGGRAISVDASIYDQVLEVVQEFPGTKVSSGYRTAAENAAANGAPDSDHLLGLAADFTGPAGLLSRLWSWATQMAFPYVEPLGQSGDHVHISFARAGAGGSSIGSSSSGGTTGSSVATSDPLGCSTALLLIASAIVYLVLVPFLWH